MTESTSASSDSTPAVKQDSTLKTTDTSVKKKASLSSIFNSTILALIALLVSMASFFFVMDHTQTLKKNLDETLVSQSNLNEKNKNLENDVQQLRKNYQELTQTLQKQQQELQQQLKDLSQANTSPVSDAAWKMSEIDYYLTLAQLNLQYHHRAESARLLLEVANKQLTTLNDAKYTALKQEINKNIQALATLNEDSSQEVLTEIKELRLQIVALPSDIASMKTIPLNTTSLAVVEEDKVVEPSFWQRAWQQAAVQLEKIVTVRRIDDKTFPSLTLLQQYTLQFYVDFLLKMTEIAVLQQNQKIYQFSLSQLQEIIKRYYTATISTTDMTKLMDKIDQLKSKDLIANLPNINNTLALWQSINFNKPSIPEKQEAE